MAEIHCLLTAMDRLWFHHIILLSEPNSIILSKNIATPSLSSQSSSSSSDSFKLEEDKPSTNSPPNSVSQCKDDCNDEVEVVEKAVIMETERPTRQSQNQIVKEMKTRPPCRTFHRPCRSLTFTYDIPKCLELPRSLSCRSSYDLEQQEVQGFKDLGFQFEKDQLTPRTMCVVPGLQRLGGRHDQSPFNDIKYITSPIEGEEGDNKEEKIKVKPYLSEAWEVKTPNSPLLRLRMARVNTKEDMEKCLMLWAKTVATSIHLDR